METSATGALHPDLARLSHEIRETLTGFELLLEGLNDHQFNWRPAPGRWSLAQNLGHLISLNGQDLDPMAQAIERARRRRLESSGPFHYAWIWRYLIHQMDPPVKTKFKAPKNYEPPPKADLAPTLDEFRRISHRLLELASLSSGLDLARTKTPMPALRWVKMPLGARITLLAAHDRRHLWQSRDVRNHAKFP